MTSTWKGLVNKLVKVDLHIHTRYSMDCGTSLDDLISRCLALNIDCVAIADHGTIDGAVKLRSIAPFKVLIAEEILTPYGEIMGIFLKESIPSGLSVDETITRIKDQGGLVCIPHPFDHVRSSALDSEVIERLVAEGQIDMVEVINSRTILKRSLDKARDFATKHNITPSAGSDAHTLTEVGNAYVEMAEFDGRDDFLQALARGTVCGHRTSPLVHFRSLTQRLKKQIL